MKYTALYLLTHSYSCTEQQETSLHSILFIHYSKELSEAGYSFENEFEEAVSFLHENGILLHYDDSSLLNDLYFVDPQWLCRMLAKIITIRPKNPYSSNG